MGIGELTLLINAIATLFIGLTLWLYYVQLRVMKDASKGQNVLAVVNLLSAQHVRDARCVVRTILPTKPLPWNKDEELAASLVCGTYDITGILLKSGIVPADPFLENWGDSITHCHQVLEPFIQHMRTATQGGPRYWDDFDWLNEQVAAYRARHHA